MTSHYRRGRSFEYYVKRMLEKQFGAYVVRSAGSHGVADLVAFFSDKVLLIQCKKRDVRDKEFSDIIKEMVEKVGCEHCLYCVASKGSNRVLIECYSPKENAVYGLVGTTQSR